MKAKVARVPRGKDEILLSVPTKGSMLVDLYPDKLTVNSVSLLPAARAEGVGTQLYEAAFEEACRQGKPLLSDDMRSAYAEAFWRKQARKGRARCAQKAPRGKYWHDPLQTQQASLYHDCKRLFPFEHEKALRCAQARLKAMTALLPKPKTPPRGEPYWPCGRWELRLDKCGSSLDGLPAYEVVPEKGVVRVSATQDGRVVGRMLLDVEPSYVTVGSIETEAHARGAGIGTRMYELALEEACKRGVPLVSDTMRSRFAEAFWRKQARKGRAACLERGRGFVLKTPMLEMQARLERQCLRKRRDPVWAARCAEAQLKAMTALLPKPKPARDVDDRETWPCWRWGVPKEKCGTSLDGLAGPGWRKKDERMYQHILASCSARGRGKKTCQRVAAATVNARRGSR
jgi:GNAT superfamily N-acetyltransferase